MALTAVLASRALAVDAGGSVSTELALSNDGPEPVAVRVAVAGEARPYSWVAPDNVTVEKGTTTVVKVGFHLPLAAVPEAGLLTYQVTAGPAVPVAGTVEVRPYAVLSASLAAAQPADGGSARHELTVGNRGNAAVDTSIRVSSADDGLDVKVEPTTLTVPYGGAPVRATVQVTPRTPPRKGEDRTFTFRVVAEPARGKAVEIGGEFRQSGPPARRKPPMALTVGLVAVGLVAVALVATRGGGSPSAIDVTATSVANACPATDHIDPHGATGLTPDRIPGLPAGYSFFSVDGERCNPVRFNPCEPIHFVVNPAGAPPTGLADVKEAFNRLAQATGITFVDDGTAAETGRRGPYVPALYPGRWAPILISWTSGSRLGPQGEVQVVGRGAGMRTGNQYVSGVLTLNADAVIDEVARTPVPGGFGPQIGTGTGAIGAQGVAWGRIILHELGHVIGLGHVRDKDQIMYPETADQTFRPSDYRVGDREGLKLLGRPAGCLATPPVPTS